MANRNSKFLLKRSNTPGKVPLPGDLLLGELALNTADVILYTSGTTANQILPIGWDRLSITGGTVTGNVTITSGLSVNHITYDTTPTTVPELPGTTYWDVDDNVLAIRLNGYIVKVGEDQFYPVTNQTGSNIPKGTAVRFNGTLGSSGRLLVAPFIADGTFSSSFFMGITAEDINDGTDGKVLWFGRIRGIDTSAYSGGTILYASTTVAGGFQTAVPQAPNNIVQIAAVVTQSVNQGTIFVRPTIGSNINNDEGVKITTPTTGQLLQLQSNGLWENKTLTQIGLVTGTGAAGQVSFWNGTTTQTGDNGLFWDNTNKRLGIGTTSPSDILHVQGSGAGIGITIQNTATGGRDFRLQAGLGGITQTGFSIFDKTAQTSRLYIDNSGNVGIGTTAPTQRLHINGSGARILIQDTNQGAAGFVAGRAAGEVFLGNDGALPLSFLVNNTERMRITAGGNLLVGTTTDSGEKLQVFNGAISVRTSALGVWGSLRFGTNNPSWLDTWAGIDSDAQGIGLDVANLRFYTSLGTRAERMRITAGGNLLVGTTTDVTGRLQISGGNLLTRGAVGGGVFNLLYVDTTNANARNWSVGASVFTFGDFGINQSNAKDGNPATSGTIRFYISPTGNVGIGTTSPNGKLHVAAGGGDGSAIIRIAGTASDTFNWASSTMYPNLTNGETTIHLIGKAESQYNSANFGYRHVADGSTSNMVTIGMFAADYLVNILGSGNVGIGTTSPSAKLQVVKGSQSNTVSIANSAAYIYGSDVGLAIGQDNGAGNYGTWLQSIRVSDNVSFSMALNPNGGNVGIGTLAPAEKLDVQGNIRITKVLLSNQENLDVDSGATRIIATIASATYDGAFFDFVIKKGTSLRVGTVYAVHNGTSVEFTETSTNDLGNTSDVTLSVDLSGGNIRLLATTLSNDWIIKVLVRGI